jgi:DNA-binding NarL/FixJ family response regulator
MKQINILIADIYSLNRDCWVYFLNNSAKYNVVSQCDDANKTLELIAETQPEVVLININKTFYSWLEVIRKIHAQFPDVHIVCISNSAHPAYARKMINAGAKSCITINCSLDEMMHAIQEAVDGRNYVCEEIKNTLMFQLLDKGNPEPDINSISKREFEIINLIKAGYSSKQIGGNLSISSRTVEAHRYNILKKLKFKNTVSLINFINASEMFA